MEELLTKLKEKLKMIEYYDQVINLMYWDMETQLPKKACERRNEALSHFSTEAFKLGKAEDLREILDELAKEENFEQLDSMWRFNVVKLKKSFDESSRVPDDFYKELVTVRTESFQAWQEAKAKEDYSLYEPHLQKIIDYTRRCMEYMYPDKPVYEVLLDRYEEGMDSATIDRVFAQLKEELVPLVKKVLAAEQPDSSKFKRFCDTDAQRKASKLLLDYIGFDFDRGCMGESEHPFTMNWSSKDVRLTNHFREYDSLDPMFSIIHEGGHALFEQNTNSEFDGTPASSCGYMGIHESQSRFYENILGRNRNFWIPIYDKLQELMPVFKDITLDEFEREINHVSAGYIRTAADELTYGLHVILRYELEKEIFENGATAAELPELWNKKMKDYLGVVPKKPSQGVLQDMHWSDGSFGYFPSYLLGSIYDGMFLDAIREDLGDIDVILREGRISEITDWFRKKIHVYGNTRLPKEVLREVCGREVTSEPLMRYFKEKYSRIYNL